MSDIGEVVVLAFVACLIAAGAGGPVSAAAHCDFLDNPRTDAEGDTQPIRVGALGIKGEETLFAQWNATFSTYLTATAGAALGGRTFQLVYLDFDTAYEAAQHGCVDILYVNPSMYSCLELQFGAAVFATLINFRRGYDLDRFYGTIFTRSDREDIQTLEDLKGQIVEAVSISGLGACQLQWHELLLNGVDFLNDPKQVRFSYNQELIVQDVIAGHADVGMVRTDLAEGMAAEGLINITDIRVINEKDDPDFPFPYSTRLAAPEWPLASLPHTSIEVIEEVMYAVLQLESDHEAAVQGLYSGWRLPVSYLGMHQMMSKLNWIQNGECIRSEDTYDAIVCPEYHVKLPREKVAEACADQAAADERYSCPEGYICVCRPCYRLPEEQVSVSLGVSPFSQHSLSDGDEQGEDGEAKVALSEFQSIEGTCQKLEICAVVSRLDLLRVNLNDAWHDYREDLRLESIQSVWYRWWSNEVDIIGNGTNPGVQWLESTPAEGASDYPFVIAANAVGSYILEIKAEMSGGMLVQIDASPLIITVEELDCPGELSLPGASGCICATNTHYEFGECVPNAMTSGDGKWIVVAIAVPCVSAALLVLALLAYLRFRRRQGEGVWQINREDLVFGKEPEVLGDGSSGGTVTKAEYRGTTVAVKSLVERKTVGGGGRRFSSAREVNLLRPHYGFGAPLKEVRSGAVVVPEQPNSPASGPFPRKRRNTASSVLGSDWVQPFSSTSAPPADVEAPLAASSDATSSSTRAILVGNPTSTSVGPMKSLAELLERVKSMVYLRHPNITTVMGVVADEGEALMVMEYMQHRSLGALLQNETVPLESETVQSIAKDIACGMLYLHSHKPPVLHMDLKSANVLIDGNFRAKLADFGLSRSRRSFRSDSALRFLAPELLADNGEPSKATDVYAMGILLFELLTRTAAYTGSGPSEIAKQVSDTAKTPAFRPEIPESVPREVAALLADCWHPRPESRPSFSEIYSRICSWQPWEGSEEHGSGRGRAPRLAAARTTSLKTENDLSREEILHRVFPRHVADALAQGRKVEPEHHEAVTIFFSDIVGFTDISRTLDAVDVMDMLDRLYIKFDGLAEQERVFKVETIGDAYMAVANLAEKQPDHALRIARFAMSAVEAANSVLIKERDPSLGHVNIRVGFHTGPVVASVVGKLSPRYCLFGDTVNTASRMESTSTANMIHCSEKSASLLMKVAGEQLALQCRGAIPIKGKGTQVTYWVLPPVANIDAAPLLF